MNLLEASRSTNTFFQVQLQKQVYLCIGKYI